MKVVHINTSPNGGAGIAARRIQQAQLKNGVRAAFVSRTLTIDFDGDTWNDPFFDYVKPPKIDRIARRIGFIKSEYPELEAAQRKVQALLKRNTVETASIPYSHFRIEEHPLVEQADVVHLHWVGQIVDYASFFKNINKPIVWTLHDMNPFLGMFHYLEDHNNNQDRWGSWDQELTLLKKQAYSHIKKGAIVSPSKWLLGEARESGVFNDVSVFKTIPNTLDLNVFTPKDKNELRINKQIDPDAHVLLFSANALDIPRKGAALLTAALDLLERPVTVLTQGKGTIETSNPKVKIIPLGHSSDMATLAENYSVADAFLLPSLEDNLPNTMLEAMACGLPVISFAVGGMNEHIIANRNGKIVTPTTGPALAAAIDRFCVSKAVYIPKLIRMYATDNFGERRLVKAYQEVYDRITN